MLAPYMREEATIWSPDEQMVITAVVIIAVVIAAVVITTMAITAMAISKLNVLHWHAVDDQSFPLEVRSLPRLAPAAQFGPAHRYSVENITALVAYGRSRGVRVMLEVDTPDKWARFVERSDRRLGHARQHREEPETSRLASVLLSTALRSRVQTLSVSRSAFRIF